MNKSKGTKSVQNNEVFELKLPDQRKIKPNIKLVFDKCIEKLGFVPNVFRAYTLRPTKFEHFRQYNSELMLGESGLTKLEREMIAVVVSSVNHCHYCLIAHSAGVRVLSGDPQLADQLAANYRAAKLSKRQLAMLNFAWKLAETPALMTPEDRKKLKLSGFNDRDIFDIAEVTGFYSASNRLASAIGMRPNPEYYDLGR